jgi:hypothetical protein
VLEQLFHPFVIIGFFEKAQQFEMGRFHVTIHLGAPTVVGHAVGVIPFVVFVVVELVFADFAPGIVQVNVGGPQQVWVKATTITAQPCQLVNHKTQKEQEVEITHTFRISQQIHNIRTSLTGGLTVVVVLIVLVVVIIIVLVVVVIRTALVIVVFWSIAVGIESQQPPRCCCHWGMMMIKVSNDSKIDDTTQWKRDCIFRRVDNAPTRTHRSEGATLRQYIPWA